MNKVKIIIIITLCLILIPFIHSQYGYNNIKGDYGYNKLSPTTTTSSSSGGNVSSVTSGSDYITSSPTEGDVIVGFDETLLNATIDNRAVGGSGDVYFLNKLGIGTTNPTHTLNVLGDTNITGEFMGSRQSFCGTKKAISSPINAGVYLDTGYLVTMNESKGFTMVRSGSIVGVSFNLDVDSTPGGFVGTTIQVQKAGTLVFLVGQFASTTGVKSGYATQARGTDTFSAGDVLQLYYDESGDLEVDDITACVEVQYNT